jgi:hypothetical protein
MTLRFPNIHQELVEDKWASTQKLMEDVALVPN